MKEICVSKNKQMSVSKQSVDVKLQSRYMFLLNRIWCELEVLQADILINPISQRKHDVHVSSISLGFFN